QVSKLFGGVHALEQVDFALRPAEIVAIVGDNGAGKSTLMKIISGLQPNDGGEVLIDGQPVALRRPADATALGIETVYQDLMLCVTCSTSPTGWWCCGSGARSRSSTTPTTTSTRTSLSPRSPECGHDRSQRTNPRDRACRRGNVSPAECNGRPGPPACRAGGD